MKKQNWFLGYPFGGPQALFPSNPFAGWVGPTGFWPNTALEWVDCLSPLVKQLVKISC